MRKAEKPNTLHKAVVKDLQQVGPLLWQRSSVLSVTEARKFDSGIFRYKTRDNRDCGGVRGTTLARSSVLSVTEARKFDSGVFRYKTREKRDCGGLKGTNLARSSVLSVTEARKFDSGVFRYKPEIKEIVVGSGHNYSAL